MYCSQCGKKVIETMLFCPFCGSPIVIPEQDEKQQTAVIPAVHAQETSPVPEIRTESNSAPAEKENSQVAFVPLDMNLFWSEPVSAEDAAAPNDDLTDPAPKEAIRLQGRKPDLSATRASDAPTKAARMSPDSTANQRPFNPDDIFFDDDEDEDEDDYEELEDDFEDDDYEDDDEDFDFEEPESSNFFVRHIRGFVSLIMFIIVAIVIAIWAFSASGQKALARNCLAWRPDVYVEIALESYQNESYAQAGKYYEEAFERKSDRYEYANSAGVAYYMAGDSVNAEAMARQAIKLDPARMEAYELLLRLYPEANNCPAEIRVLLQNGYELTGNAALNR